jgi:RNA polymerase sigma-70 factor (ECF subfamily)
MIDAQIEALYKDHGFHVYQRCRALLGNDDEAYDALQEVFIRVIRSRPELDDDRPITAWLNRVTTNLCFNRIRARRYRRHVSIEAMGGVADRGPVELMQTLLEQRDLIRRLLLPVDERTRHVVVSYFFDEHSVQHIGAELEISVPTVRRVLKRFLKNARKRLVRAEAKALVGKRKEA